MQLRAETELFTFRSSEIRPIWSASDILGHKPDYLLGCIQSSIPAGKETASMSSRSLFVGIGARKHSVVSPFDGTAHERLEEEPDLSVEI